jgi:hypothetical protein
LGKINRGDINEEYACSGYVEAGDFVFLTFALAMSENRLKIKLKERSIT